MTATLAPGDFVAVQFPDRSELIGPLRLLWIADGVATVNHPALTDKDARQVPVEYVRAVKRPESRR